MDKYQRFKDFWMFHVFVEFLSVLLVSMPMNWYFVFCMLYCLGYEVSGLENIPDDSPALIVYYHGAIPIDLYYFISKTFLFKNRLIHTVADRFLFKMPGKYIMCNVILNEHCFSNLLTYIHLNLSSLGVIW